IESLITYSNTRPSYVWEHLRGHFALSDPFILSIESLDTAAGSVKVNTVTVATEFWSGRYFAEAPVTVTAVAKAGYRFSHWSGFSNATDSTVRLSLGEDVILTPVFVAD